MANTTIKIPRGHLIMALCLPLAVFLGYLLADPLESESMAVIVLLVSVLAVPLMMKWHHPLLILSWNSLLYPFFLPGHAPLWLLMAVLALFFGVLNRAVNSERKFVNVPALTKPLLFLTAVVLVTAMMTGGIGIRSFGAEKFGGKNYVFLLGGIAGYFAFTSQRIPLDRAYLYVGMFFLSSMTGVVADLLALSGRSMALAVELFIPSDVGRAVDAAAFSSGTLRLGLVNVSASGVLAWLLSRYGVRELLSLSKPWRLLAFGLTIIGCVVGGFRSALAAFALTFAAVFWLEGLWKTRWLPALLGAFVIIAAILVPQVQKLPFVVQRTLSFLPLPIDPMAKLSGEASSEWRFQMWRELVPQIPQYLIKGKGYNLDPNELFMASLGSLGGFGIAASGALVCGDYHNGPLSLIIPLGIFGVIGFVWFVVATLRMLYYHYKNGDPALYRINTLLLGLFIVKVFVFCFIFGSFYSELCMFTGLAGLSVSLNGPPEAAPAKEEQTEEFSEQFA